MQKKMADDLLVQIGDFLRRIRKKNGLSISEVAKAVSFARESLSRFENGHRSVTMSTLQKLASGYQMANEEQATFARMVLGIEISSSQLKESRLKTWEDILFEILRLPEEDKNKLIGGLISRQ